MDEKDLPKLSDKQSQFIEEWLTNGMNGTEAYRTVYNTVASSRTCTVEASRMLKNPNISPWIDYYRQKRKEVFEKEIAYTAFDAFQEIDDLKTIALESLDKEGRPNISAAIKAVETKIKLKGLFKDDPSINNSIVMQMGDVEVDGVSLGLNIGESIDDKQSEITEDT